MTKAKETNVSGASQTSPRKRYHTPKLCSFGTVTQLTRSVGMGMIDDGVMGMTAGS